MAERLARNELDEQIIEIELEPEEAGSSVFEFVAGMSTEDLATASTNSLAPCQRAPPQPPGARQRGAPPLTQEEANKLIDFETVVEQATQRVEQSGVVFLDEMDKIVGSKVDSGPDVSGEGVQRDLLPSSKAPRS